MNPAAFEDVVNRLAAAIDGDEPPGMAAHGLARATVALVHDREPRQALFMVDAMHELHKQFPQELEPPSEHRTTRDEAAKEMVSILLDKLVELQFLSIVLLIETGPDGRVLGTRTAGTIPRKLDAARLLMREAQALHAEAGGDESATFGEQIIVQKGPLHS